MPVVHVELYEGRPKEIKAEVAKAITNEMVRILSCKPDAVMVIFSDVKKENWAKAGVLVSDLPK